MTVETKDLEQTESSAHRVAHGSPPSARAASAPPGTWAVLEGTQEWQYCVAPSLPGQRLPTGPRPRKEGTRVARNVWGHARGRGAHKRRQVSLPPPLAHGLAADGSRRPGGRAGLRTFRGEWDAASTPRRSSPCEARSSSAEHRWLCVGEARRPLEGAAAAGRVPRRPPSVVL